MSIGSLSLKRARMSGARLASGARYASAAALLHPIDTKENARTASVQVAEHTADIPANEKINMVRPPKEVTDFELLERFQHGDEDGYVELYLRRQAEVFTFALRLAGGDRDLASDVFQETFIKVYRKAHTFREGTNVLGWLYTIVRTTFLNHRRRRTLVGLDDAAEVASSDRTLAPEFREEQSTLRARVEGAILGLPIEIREPFVLREMDGLSYQEIAEQLHITHGAVRQRIYRAKLAMREQLSDLVNDEDIPAQHFST
ncbi:MAG TPA: sigma-70 family RNA polymerase sigma factor [Candidatus Kapabacteria bacterium]|nr:sigma-70 family RNA polymerase sigma factor [Candidatus Kapabacteria bacterium]